MKNTTKNTLETYEWLAVTVLATLLVFIGLHTFLNREELPLKSVYTNEPFLTQDIQITVEGRVHKPGVYHLSKGTTVQQLIDLVDPYDDADLSRWNPKEKLLTPKKIKIPIMNRSNARKTRDSKAKERDLQELQDAQD